MQEQVDKKKKEKKRVFICADYQGMIYTDGTENKHCYSADALVDEEDGFMELGEMKCEFHGKGEGDCPFFKYRPEDKVKKFYDPMLKIQAGLDAEILKIFAPKLSLPDLMILADGLSKKMNAMMKFLVKASA